MLYSVGFLPQSNNHEDTFQNIRFAGSVFYTGQQIKDRAQVVEAGDREPRQFGLHGLSEFIRQLPYTDPNNLWVMPMAHAALFGVVKDFWDLMLAPKKGKLSVTIQSHRNQGMTNKC